MVRLIAALVPPSSIATALLAAAHQEPPSTPARARRRRVRREPAEEPAAGALPALELPGPRDLHLQLARYGNVVPADARRIGAALARRCAEIAPLDLWLGEVVALEPLGHDGIGLKVEVAQGAAHRLDELRQVAVSAAEEIGIFGDRRSFRPVLDVARVNDRTTEQRAQTLIDALIACPPMSWRADTLILRRQVDSGGAAYQDLERVALAGRPPA